MRVDHSSIELRLFVFLDDEEIGRGVRLDGADQLGRRLLEIALEGCRACFVKQASPLGRQWDALADSTVRQRGRAGPIGIITGGLSGGLDWDEGDHEVDRDRAWWQYTREPFGKAHGFHNGNERTGQPPRPFLGWTRDAQAEARREIERAATGQDPDDDRPRLGRGP